MSRLGQRHTIQPRLSPARRRWLEQLEREGVANRPRGTSGYHCMQLGWTDFLVELPCGRRITFRGADSYTSLPHPRPEFKNLGEVLTAEGRAVLEQARAEELKR